MHPLSPRYKNLIESYYLTSSKAKPESCHLPSHDLIIDSNGDIKPCFHRNDICLGNILDMTLEEAMSNVTEKNNEAMLKADCFGEHCISLFQ